MMRMSWRKKLGDASSFKSHWRHQGAQGLRDFRLMKLVVFLGHQDGGRQAYAAVLNSYLMSYRADIVGHNVVAMKGLQDYSSCLPRG